MDMMTVGPEVLWLEDEGKWLARDDFGPVAIAVRADTLDDALKLYGEVRKVGLFVGFDGFWCRFFLCDFDGNEVRDFREYYKYNGLCPTYFFKTREAAEAFGMRILKGRLKAPRVGMLARSTPNPILEPLMFLAKKGEDDG